MVNHTLQPQRLLLFGILLLLGPLIGLALTAPSNLLSLAALGAVIGALLFPVLLKWHHLLLIMSWNAAINFFFLPGKPELWMVMTGISVGFSVMDRIMVRKQTDTTIPSVIWPLIFLALVVMATSKVRGGFGLEALGGGVIGGKRYIFIAAAILGYFALAGQRVPIGRANLYVALFFLGSLTAMVSNLAYFAGPAFYFLFYLFPAGYAWGQAMADYAPGGAISRLMGFSFAGPAIYYLMLLRYGVAGVLRPDRIWRLVIVVVALAFGLMGGFRSMVVTTGILFIVLFFLERLYRTRFVIVLALGAVVGGTVLAYCSKSLPLPIQRSISFLPVEIDARAKYDAQASTEWRLRMWNVLIGDIPKYFWLGKGYAIDSAEMYLRTVGLRLGIGEEVDLTILGGSYHNGPLTLLVPLGVWGVIGFLWFAFAAVRVLYRNYRDGPAELKRVNTFLLGYFVMRLIYFLFFYGQFAEDLFVFTGTLGLSVSINGAVRKPATELAPQEKAVVDLSPLPGLQRA